MVCLLCQVWVYQSFKDRDPTMSSKFEKYLRMEGCRIQSGLLHEDSSGKTKCL